MINYEEEFENLRAQTAAAEKLLQSTERGLNTLFSEMFFDRFKNSEDVKFHLLDQAKHGVVMELPTVKNGVIHTIKEKKQIDNHIRYLTNWSSGSMLPNHYHSDCDEVITNTNGFFSVILDTGEKFYLNPGEKIEVAAGVKHQVTALEKGSLVIDFYKCNKENITSAMT